MIATIIINLANMPGHIQANEFTQLQPQKSLSPKGHLPSSPQSLKDFGPVHNPSGSLVTRNNAPHV